MALFQPIVALLLFVCVYCADLALSSADSLVITPAVSTRRNVWRVLYALIALLALIDIILILLAR